MITKTDYKITAAIFMVFSRLIVVGNLLLASAFNFPDILRESPTEGFTLFQNNQGTIIPAYYMMGVTSILQILMAVAMYHLMKKRPAGRPVCPDCGRSFRNFPGAGFLSLDHPDPHVVQCLYH